MDKKVLEIKIPKDSEDSLELAVGVFAALSNYHSSFWQRLFNKEKCLVFEIGLFDQTIHFYAVVEKDFEPYLIAQLGAQYPKSAITESENFLANWNLEKADFGQLVLSKPYWLPLKTYKDFQDTDPLASVLGTLAKAGPDDKAIIQLVIIPAGASYQGAARGILEKGIPTPNGQSTRNHPQSALITQKLTQKAFKAGLRVLTISINKQSSSAFLSHLAGSFGGFTLGEGNDLTLKKEGLFKNKL